MRRRAIPWVVRRCRPPARPPKGHMLTSFPQVSQKRIAEEAGVSQATVSLVLAGRGVSSEETTRKVMEAAERLKYRPNLLVHGIQTGKTRMIGVMAAPVDFYWAEVL